MACKANERASRPISSGDMRSFYRAEVFNSTEVTLVKPHRPRLSGETVRRRHRNRTGNKLRVVDKGAVGLPVRGPKRLYASPMHQAEEPEACSSFVKPIAIHTTRVYSDHGWDTGLQLRPNKYSFDGILVRREASPKGGRQAEPRGYWIRTNRAHQSDVKRP
jgi:hypothetical protein